MAVTLRMMLKGVEISVMQFDKQLSPIVLPSLSALPSLCPHSFPPIGWITRSALVLRCQQAGYDSTVENEPALLITLIPTIHVKSLVDSTLAAGMVERLEK